MAALIEQTPLRVLLVEDDADDALLLTRSLSSMPFDIQRADRLSQALERLRNEPYDLVILDLALPDSQGFDTFLAVRRASGRKPIVVLTGFDDHELGLKTLQAGAQDYLVKGQASFEVLVRAIRYSVERARVEDEMARSAEALRARNAELERDLNLAREIQTAFLPQRYPTFGDNGVAVSPFRFCQRYVPTCALGGDFFDVLRVSKDEAGIIVGDVMGHGVRAALVTAMLRGLIDERSPISRHPSQMLSHLNQGLRDIWKDIDSPMFVTAIYAVINSRTGQVQFANAGHPSPLWLKSGRGNEVLGAREGETGPALGLSDTPEFPVGQAHLSRGDRVFFFTDGLYEVDDPSGEFYGQAKLRKAAAEAAGLDPEAFLEQLLSNVRAFSGSSVFADDACLLSVDFMAENASRLPATDVRYSESVTHR